jgi:hypothetical protein
MSIAEQIMLGTQQQSKNWSVLSENLGRLGREVGNQLALEQYQKQAAAELPVIQQQMQAALQDAGSGRSADAYSKLLPLISNPQYNQNPMLLPALEFAMKATKDESDNFLMKQKTQQGSQYGIADLLLAKQFGVDLPQQPGAVTPPATGQPPTTPKPPATGQPPIVEPSDDLTAKFIDDDQQALTDSANVFSEIQQKVQNEGTSAALASLNYVDDTQFSDKNIKENFDIIKLPQSASRFLGEGIETMAVPKNIEGLRQKGITIKGQLGNISYENVNNSEESKNLRQKFLSTIDSQINRLDKSTEINELIRYYGGFDKIGPYTEGEKGVIYWKIKDKEGKDKTIKLRPGTADSPGLKELFIGVINAPNQAAILGMPMLRSEGINIPAPNVPSKKQNLAELEGRVGTDPKTGKKFKIVNGTPVAVD